MNTPELREECAEKLLATAPRSSEISAFVGFDGFVDEIIHVVDKRYGADKFDRIPTIAALAERLAEAAGRSTNIELVTTRTKLGGNGPIMANALASFGLRVTYLGTLGYPHLHPVFEEFAKRAEVYSIVPPATTDALEFQDGKLMLGKHSQLKEMTWANIQERFGREKFAGYFGNANLVAFVNWTMVPYMSEIWESLQAELCPTLSGPRRKIFFDLADPQKRLPEDILKALKLITNFQKYFDVILGLNEKEAFEIGEVLGLPQQPDTREGLSELSLQIHSRVPVDTLVVHPVAYALAVSHGQVDIVNGPYIAKPLITTGAGDHFNAGFCLGKLLGFSNQLSVLTGVATSGHYVRTAESPSLAGLAETLRSWTSR